MFSHNPCEIGILERLKHWSLLLLIASFTFVSPAYSERILSLSEATAQAQKNNPELNIFTARHKKLQGVRQSAELTPAYELGIETENVLGSDVYKNLNNAETTLSLSSVIELGGKRGARTSLIDSRSELLEKQQKVKALNILSQVSQSFITTLSLQEKLRVANDALLLSKESVGIVRNRVSSGAAHEAELLRAVATHEQTQLTLESLQTQFEVSKMTLATTLGATSVDFDRVNGDLFHFALAPEFEQLYQRARSSPEIEVYATQGRIHQAELQLARSQSRSNVRWQVGVKHFSSTDDTALTAGVSIPLLSGKRANGEIHAAKAASEVTEYEKESALLLFRSRLYEAWKTHQQRASAAQRISKNILPMLTNALQQIQSGYERGGYSYLEWVEAQNTLLDARFSLIDMATQALLNHTLIEQLTGEPLVEETKALSRSIN